MQIFRCPACGARAWFHNLTCACGAALVFDPDAQAFGAGLPCANRSAIGCNWQVEGGPLCRACAMTEVHPDLAEPENVALWAETELAKRRMLANLARWLWFGPADPGARPVFRLLSEQTAAGAADVVMGHADGVITINVSEAHPATRVERRETLGELYRTMLGHLRHETAHFLFLRLAADPGFAGAFRRLFGDERADYAAALQAHYAAPRTPGPDHVTAYATAHPHEDWAETVAHLLHLVDLADSAAAAGLDPQAPGDAYAEDDAGALLTRAVDLALAVNHVNRALDLPDLSPFVLGPGARDKIAFAHARLRRGPPRG